jgi:hypothetical protein
MHAKRSGPEHPGNNRNDNRLQHTAANLANRPRHLRLATDWTYADASLGGHAAPDASLVDHHIVPNVGQFAFLAPFPAVMVAPTFPPSQAPPGFDRAAFQVEMHAQIETSLRRAVL